MSCVQSLGREPFHCTDPGYRLLNNKAYLTFLVNDLVVMGRKPLPMLLQWKIAK